jgi:IS1 family transposase
MCINGLKKTATPVENSLEILELDELYWFINKKEHSETRENVYIITMIRREPRQIVSFDVGLDKMSGRIQDIVDNGPEAKKYCTDGYSGYLDVVFPGEHLRNIRNKKDTYTVEGINADLRHFIPLLRRRSRCFARSIETLIAVIEVFVEAYNRFGLAKFKYRQANPSKSPPLGFVDFLYAR